jgi:hypothetical protein
MMPIKHEKCGIDQTLHLPSASYFLKLVEQFNTSRSLNLLTPQPESKNDESCHLSTFSSLDLPPRTQPGTDNGRRF